MDIAIIGPEKFAFQDMACIDLALSCRSSESFILVPEPEGGEDASLVWNDASSVTLEVQVKGAKGIAGITHLAKYLTHYPPRKAKGSLLHRLIERPETHALFILTARCNDELTPLLVTSPLTGKPTARSVPNTLVMALQKEIATMATRKAKSKLSSARLNDLAALATRPITELEQALAKTILLDQQTAEIIEVRLHNKLRIERFDTLSIRGILARFCDLLAVSKRSQSDALAPISQVLTDHAPSAIRPNSYHERGIENDLEKRLCKDRVILLAGPPRAGKSWAARAVAGRLQLAGYEVRQGTSVNEAERFLTDHIGAERVYVLDDPIGSREPHFDAATRLAALRALCERVPTNRRLIVAQSEHVLFATKGAHDLTACRLGSMTWLRLDPLPVEVALVIWRSVAGTQSVLKNEIVRVAELINRDPSLRDPGALVHLAQTWSELREGASDDEIRFHARKDAADFARSLAEEKPSLRDLLTASALATTASDGAAVTDLAFIINGGSEEPGLDTENGVFIFDDTPQPLPAYSVKQQLYQEQQFGLEELQRRRVIVYQDSRFNFTHPYLRAGAQTLVSPDIPPDLKRVCAQLKRAIACPSPVTSLAAARNLRWIHSLLQGTGDNTVFKIARSGIDSMFPATRDCCFEFLIESADLLPKDLRDALPNFSEHMVIELNRIDVTHGIGIISHRLDSLITSSSIKEVKPYLDAIEKGSPIGLDISLSRRILKAVERHPADLTVTAMRRFLHADEAVVRASAAQLWIRLPRKDDEDILSRISNDNTPVMSGLLLKALPSCWQNLPDDRREQILSVISKHALSPSCATIMFNRLVLFNRQEHFGKQPPWQVFATLMPTVIAKLPLSVTFNNGRFNVIIDHAVQKLLPSELIPVLRGWAQRLLKQIGHYTLTEFDLAIVEPLLETATSEVRMPILKDLLNVSDTGARTVFVKSLTNNWRDLAPEERELLKKVLNEVQDDARWLSAAVLTRYQPPLELVTTLTGNSATLTLSIEDIERNLQTPLFSACVHMFVGWPQPLWWYATHHSGNQTWKRVISDLAHSPDHTLHTVAFYEIANFGGESELANLIDKLPDAALYGTFERLLDFKMSCVGTWRPLAWQRLLARAEQAKLLDSFIERIDNVLDGILEDPADINSWLGEGGLARNIFNLIRTDLHAIFAATEFHEHYIAILETMRESEGFDQASLDGIFRQFCTKYLNNLNSSPPRIYGSWAHISNVFRKMGAPSETLSVLEAGRTSAIQRHREIRKHFRGSPSPFNLDGWIDQAHPDF